MSKHERLQNFVLPLMAGVLLAIPAYLMHREPHQAAQPPAAAKPPADGACSPFAQTFDAMRSEADRIAQTASSLALTDGDAEPADTAERWARVAASAGSLGAWVARERSAAGLTLGETAILTDATPLLDDLHWEAEEIARRVGTPSADEAVLAARAQAAVQAAGAVARLIDPLTACREAERFMSYSPHPACETLDPEFQYAMAGACVQ